MAPADPVGDLVVAIAQLQDRHAVIEVMASYAAGVDRRDWDLVESCFCADAHVEGTRLTAGFGDYFPIFKTELLKFDRTVHFLGNQRVRVEGDEANLETYAIARHFWTDTASTPQQMTISVRYFDELRRGDSGWAIARRRVELDWSDTTPPGPQLSWTIPLSVDARRSDTA